MPDWFRFPGAGYIWIPMDMTPQNLGERVTHQYCAIARLKIGATVATAQADLQGIAKRLERQYPESNQKVGPMVVSLKEQIVGNSRSQILIMLGAVGFVLLIACTNVANLLLARATGRRRELVVRQALGASRGRVVQQLLSESVLLSLLGAGLGVCLAWVSLRVLATGETHPFPQPNPIGLDGTVLIFTLGIGVLVGILFGLVPLIEGPRRHLYEGLRSNPHAALTTSGRGRIIRNALVVSEIAISLTLLSSAGLLLRSFVKLREVRVGLQPEGVLTAQLVLPPKKYATLEKSTAFFERLLDGLRSAPEIQAAAVGSQLPLEGGTNGNISVDGHESTMSENPVVEQTAITSDYFRVLGVPFIKGRDFSQQDFQETARSIRRVYEVIASGKKEVPSDLKLTAIINQSMASRFWPEQDPLGRVFRIWGALPVRVIAIVGDVKETGVRQPVMPQAYFPLPLLLEPPVNSMSLVIKSAVSKKQLLSVIHSHVSTIDSNLALFNVRTMQEIISNSITDARYESLLVSCFGFLALLLTTVGIYGVMAYTVTQRAHEFGIRLALGAHQGVVLRLAIGQGIKLALAGLTLGIAGVLVTTRYLTSVLFGIQPRDPLTIVGVATLLFVDALVASYIPARRATKIDPMVALRYE